MINYIIPLADLILDLACFAFCLKFVISSEIKYWFFPLLMSLSITVASILCLMSIVLENSVQEVASFAFAVSIFMLFASLFWLIAVLMFNYRMKDKED